MKLRKTGRIAIAGLAAVAALTMTACGSDDSDSDTTSDKSTSQQATTTANAQAELPPVPTPADLNAQLQRALDPAVPNEEKLDMVQGAEADPNLPGQLSQAYKQSGATIEVTEVNSFGDTLNAKARFVIGDQENIVDVPFVAEDGKWKVEQTWACGLLAQAQMQSPACAAS